MAEEFDPNVFPVYQRTSPLVQDLVFDLRMLREFPDHVEAPVWRAGLELAKKQTPEPYAMARAIIAAEFAERDRLFRHPEDCPRCFGAGEFPHSGKIRKCGCPLAEAQLRHRPLDWDAYDRMVVDTPPVDPSAQLSLLPDAPAEVVAMPSPTAPGPAPAETPRDVRGFSRPSTNLIRIPDAPKRTYDKKVN